MLYILNIAKIAFPLATLPYLTRVLSVEFYGLLALTRAIMQYTQIFIDFGFLLSGTKSVVNCNGNTRKIGTEVGDILIARVILGVAVAIPLLTLCQFINPLRAHTLFIALSFIAVFITIFLFDYLFRGLEKMRIITVRFVIMKALAAALTFIYVKSDHDLILIPLFDIFGSAAAVSLVFFEIRKLKIALHFSGIKTSINKLKESVIYFYNGMAGTAFMALNTVLIGFFMTPENVAFWSLTLQIVTAILSFYTPITDGLYPYMIRTKSIRIIGLALTIFLPIILAGSLACYYFGELGIIIIAGPEYVAATPVLKAMIPVIILSFPTMLFGWPTLGSIGKEYEVTKSMTLAALSQVIGLIILLYSNSLTLVNVALLRGSTELLLLATRLNYIIKFRTEFK